MFFKGKSKAKEKPNPNQVSKVNSGSSPELNLNKADSKKARFLTRINKWLFITWILLLVGLFISLRPFLLEKVIPVIQDEETKDNNKQRALTYEPKPVSYYLDIISRQNLFRLLARSAKPENVPKIPQVSPLELLANYSLSGVLKEAPFQAIIEDKKAQKTYFLSPGQSLGEFKVEDIQDGKVILELNGQKFELNL